MNGEKIFIALYIFVIENNRSEQEKCFVHIKNLIVFPFKTLVNFLFVCLFVCPCQGVFTRDTVIYFQTWYISIVYDSSAHTQLNPS